MILYTNFQISNMLRDFANTVRILACEMTNRAGSGHQGGALGFADVVSVLFNKSMNFLPNDPMRDRLVLSAGHMSAMLYAAIYLSQKTDLTLDDLKSFRRFNSLCQGHPKINKDFGIEITTGALGQGIATAVGIAIALKKKKLNSKVFVIAGDGDLMEGVSHEAATLAKSLNLNNLIILFDNNNACIDGKAESFTTDNIERFKAYGFQVIEANGHDFDQIEKALEKTKNSESPAFVSFKTTIGKYSKLEGSHKCHGKFLSDDDISKMRKEFGFSPEPFSVPFEVSNKISKTKASTKVLERKIEISDQMFEIKNDFIKNPQSLSTRQLNGIVLNKLSKHLKSLIGGSADLSKSTGLYFDDMKEITASDFDGNFIHFGIREHAMGCAMNGLASEGFVPYGGTFLIFSDYMRPAIRNAALMGVSSIFVLTHDSIGVGQDGETHQPVEQLSSLRLVPNLLVMRPCCDVEVAECVEIAVESQNKPSALILSRQNVKNFIKKASNENHCKRGMYELQAYQNNRKKKLAIIASGTEVEIAFETMQLLQAQFDIKIVSAVCLELFEEQPAQYKKETLSGDMRVVIEAGAPDLWYKYLSSQDRVFGVTTFGMSGTAQDLFEHFGLTAEKISKKILNI